MFTLFDEYDFSGKTIIPFNTNEGSRNAGTYETIQKLEPNAKVLEGLPIRGIDMDKNQIRPVRKWAVLPQMRERRSGAIINLPQLGRLRDTASGVGAGQ